MVFYFVAVGAPSLHIRLGSDLGALSRRLIPPDPKYILYMGKDKYENEELIKWAFPEDIWLALTLCLVL